MHIKAEIQDGHHCVQRKCNFPHVCATWPCNTSFYMFLGTISPILALHLWFQYICVTKSKMATTKYSENKPCGGENIIIFICFQHWHGITLYVIWYDKLISMNAKFILMVDKWDSGLISVNYMMTGTAIILLIHALSLYMLHGREMPPFLTYSLLWQIRFCHNFPSPGDMNDKLSIWPSQLQYE